MLHQKVFVNIHGLLNTLHSYVQVCRYLIIHVVLYLKGYRQAVRHRTLTPVFAGSNPASPVPHNLGVCLLNKSIDIDVNWEHTWLQNWEV